MNRDPLLTFTPINHPNPKVRRVGFGLDDPYVERCWSAVVGPSGTLLLRRMPVLWSERVPAVVPASELGRSIGLGAGTGPNSRVSATLERLVQFHLVRRGGRSGDQIEVFVEVPPLTRRQLARVPAWTRSSHERLLGTHLDGIAAAPDRDTTIATTTARLDRLQRRSAPAADATTGRARGLGR